MMDKDHIHNLIKEKNRRLHELQLQQARFGFNSPPEVNTEIMTIKETIEELYEQLRDQPSVDTTTAKTADPFLDSSDDPFPITDEFGITLIVDGILLSGNPVGALGYLNSLSEVSSRNKDFRAKVLSSILSTIKEFITGKGKSISQVFTELNIQKQSTGNDEEDLIEVFFALDSKSIAISPYIHLVDARVYLSSNEPIPSLNYPGVPWKVRKSSVGGYVPGKIGLTDH
jgi:hypothetical protein